MTAASAFGTLSAVNLVGILAAGWLSDRVHRPTLLALIYAMRGLSFLLLMNVAGDPRLLFLFAAVFGLFDYATAPVVASIVATRLGIRFMGLAMELLGAGHALGAAAGAMLGGFAFDILGTYDALWLLSLGLASVAALLVLGLDDKSTPSPDTLPA